MIFDKLRTSFAARLRFFILWFNIALFVVAFTIFYHFSIQIIERNARTESEDKLKIISLQIETVLRRVEAVPDNLNWVITSGKIQPDTMFNITKSVIRNNSDIYGSAIAFEPYYFKEKGYYFSPYSYRDGDTIRSLQLGNKDYDYFTWEWYSKPKELKTPCWSDPYYDEGGGRKIMCTYSAPIFDKNKTMIGIFTSDISLEWLTDLIGKMKLNDRSYIFMLDRKGTYIIHYIRERILNKTIFEVSKDMGEPNVKQLGENMIAGKQGMQVFNNSGISSFAFYAPVPHTQWSLAIVIPREDVFSDLRRINLLLVAIVFLGLAALLLVSTKIVNNLTNPLKRFAISARAIAHGDFTAPLPNIRSHDEMKEMHDSFSYMQSELNNYIANLKQTTSAKEKIESELRIARNIQMGMIPKTFPPFPACREIDLYAAINPAKEVGGDLYDFFMNGDKLYFAIGDVSGKGVPASLLMAVTRSLFHSVAAHANPSDVMRSLNASMSDNNESSMFVTLLIGVLDVKTGFLQYCNAGHTTPILVAQDGSCSWLEVIPNIPVGVMENFPYRMQSCNLPDSSALILYTDGVTEAENDKKELYGEKRLMETVKRNAGVSSRKMTETILSDINLHIKDNEHSDDIALLVIDYNKRHDEDMQTLSISNKIDELNKLTQFIEQLGEQMSLSPSLVMNLNLAMEEAVSNVILYAYPEQQSDKQIEITVSRNGDKLIMTVTDDGSAFDLMKKEDPDIDLPAEERPIGGLGIFLIKKIMDEVEYRRMNGNNVLTLVKKIINKQ